jgi:hypothetical protein
MYRTANPKAGVMPPMRKRHPNKHIEEAVQYAESLGWRFEKSNGHNWGFLLCPQYGQGDGHDIPIYSTPKSPEDAAKRIRRRAERCPHGREG